MTLAVEKVAVLGTVNPVSQGVGAISTGWCSVKDFDQLLALVQTGVLGTAATVDAKLEQATDGTGTGVKDITGKAITQIVKATGDNVQAVINLRHGDMDVANDFAYARLTITVGTAASLVGGMLCGVVPLNGTVVTLDAATVVEVIN